MPEALCGLWLPGIAQRQGGIMMRIVLEVPDKILHTYGRSDWSKQETVDVTAGNLREALTLRDYHGNYLFPDRTAVWIPPCEKVDDDAV